MCKQGLGSGSSIFIIADPDPAFFIIADPDLDPLIRNFVIRNFVPAPIQFRIQGNDDQKLNKF